MTSHLSHPLDPPLEQAMRPFVELLWTLLVIMILRPVAAVAPEITLPNRRIGQSRGLQTILECVITAYPQAVSFWQKDGRTVTGSNKHKIDVYDDADNARVTLSLRSLTPLAMLSGVTMGWLLRLVTGGPHWW